MSEATKAALASEMDEDPSAKGQEDPSVAGSNTLVTTLAWCRDGQGLELYFKGS